VIATTLSLCSSAATSSICLKICADTFLLRKCICNAHIRPMNQRSCPRLALFAAISLLSVARAQTATPAPMPAVTPIVLQIEAGKIYRARQPMLYGL